MAEKVMPLGFLEAGQEAVIKNVAGGNCIRTKLSEMGFVQGMKISNIRNDGFGPLIVNVMGSRLAVGRGMAQKILVEEIVS